MEVRIFCSRVGKEKRSDGPWVGERQSLDAGRNGATTGGWAAGLRKRQDHC
jgi:hypothetical protein